MRNRLMARFPDLGNIANYVPAGAHDPNSSIDQPASSHICYRLSVP